MRSELPKCLHKVCGIPMAEHVARAMKAAGVERPVIVVGHEAEKMKEALGGGYSYALQAEQLGTGHAAASAAEALKGYDGPVLVTPGDTPLLSPETLISLAESHRDGGASVTMATCLDRPNDQSFPATMSRKADLPVRPLSRLSAARQPQYGQRRLRLGNPASSNNLFVMWWKLSGRRPTPESN